MPAPVRRRARRAPAHTWSAPIVSVVMSPTTRIRTSLRRDGPPRRPAGCAASWPAVTRKTAPLFRYRLIAQVVPRGQRLHLRPRAVDDHVDRRRTGSQVIGEIGAEARAMRRGRGAGRCRRPAATSGGDRTAGGAGAGDGLTTGTRFVLASDLLTHPHGRTRSSVVELCACVSPTRVEQRRAAIRPACGWSAAALRGSGCRWSGGTRRAAPPRGRGRRFGRYEVRSR